VTAAHDDDSADDMARFGSDEPAEMICPSCRGVVTEDTTKCPHCSDWITPIDPAQTGSRRWIYVLAIIIMLLIVLRWTF
jgi:RNA polymerase subunit RPABC4/transcription elongation factor Spt4